MSENWQILGQAAAQALAAGRYAVATENFRKVVEARPGHADSWFNLAYSLRYQRRYDEATEAYDRALALGVSGPEEALVNRALIYSEHLDRCDLAAEDLRRALTLSPGFGPALLNLAMLREDLGEREAAIDSYSKLLGSAPGNGRAHARLAALDDDPHAAIDRLRKVLATIELEWADRAEVEFALGNLLDSVGRYDDAFESVVNANERMAAHRHPGLRYDPAAQEDLVSRLIATFADQPPEAGVDRGERMIFICGMFRSGSTVFEQMLAHHHAIHAGGELEYIPAFVADYLQPYPESIRSIDHAAIQSMRSEYLEAIDRLHPGVDFVTDKRPDNFLHLGLIKTLFAGARILHTDRDPLDVLLSTYFLNFAESVRYGEKLEDIAHYLTQYRRLMDHWEAIFGDDLVTVNYDHLVHEPGSVMEKTADRLGLEPLATDTWQRDLREGVIRTPSAWQARKPLHAGSSGRWRNYERHLEKFRHLFES